MKERLYKGRENHDQVPLLKESFPIDVVLPHSSRLPGKVGTLEQGGTVQRERERNPYYHSIGLA